MTTNTTDAASTTFYDRCPDWCRNSEHALRTDVSGTHRVGDDEHRDNHWRPVGRLGLGAPMRVGLIRENVHGQPWSMDLLDKRDGVEVQVCIDRDLLVVPDDSHEEPYVNTTPSAARSLARLLITAADIAEGVAT